MQTELKLQSVYAALGMSFYDLNFVRYFEIAMMLKQEKFLMFLIN